MRSWSRVGWSPVDELEDGFGWMQTERIARTSHALRVDGRVWLIDPVDAPELEGRVRALGDPAGVLQLLDRHGRDCRPVAGQLGVPHYEVPRQPPSGAAFEVVPLRRRRWWHEIALWYPEQRTLVCADAVGTA